MEEVRTKSKDLKVRLKDTFRSLLGPLTSASSIAAISYWCLQPQTAELVDVNKDGIEDLIVRSLSSTETVFYGISQGDSISGQSITYLSKSQIKEIYEEKAKKFYGSR